MKTLVRRISGARRRQIRRATAMSIMVAFSLQTSPFLDEREPVTA